MLIRFFKDLVSNKINPFKLHTINAKQKEY